MQVRRATCRDMLMMQHCNLRNLPENYNMRYYYYHYLSWPQLLYVQEDTNGKIVGYVLAKMDDEELPDKAHGHITSLATLRTHRKLGTATQVMRRTMETMQSTYDANYCSLHVRRTNEAALHLYQDTLQFRCAEIDQGYYVDNEDAFHMKRFFKGEQKGAYVRNGRLEWPAKQSAADKAKQNINELLEELGEVKGWSGKKAGSGGGGGGGGGKKKGGKKK